VLAVVKDAGDAVKPGIDGEAVVAPTQRSSESRGRPPVGALRTGAGKATDAASGSVMLTVPAWIPPLTGNNNLSPLSVAAVWA